MGGEGCVSAVLTEHTSLQRMGYSDMVTKTIHIVCEYHEHCGPHL